MYSKKKSEYYYKDGNKRYFDLKSYLIDFLLDNSDQKLCINCDHSFSHKVKDTCIYCIRNERYENLNNCCNYWKEYSDDKLREFFMVYHDMINGIEPDTQWLMYSEEEIKQKRII